MCFLGSGMDPVHQHLTDAGRRVQQVTAHYLQVRSLAMARSCGRVLELMKPLQPAALQSTTITATEQVRK